VALLGVELACLACLHQLDDILKGCRLVKYVSKGFTDQHAERCMVSTLASMDFCEQIAALLPDNAPHLDTIGTTLVEILFYQWTIWLVEAMSSGRMLFGCTEFSTMSVTLGGLHVARTTESTIFLALHQELELRWRPWLIGHLSSHSPRRDCVVARGPQSPFLVCTRGADR
jgi:hypothetical protein